MTTPRTPHDALAWAHNQCGVPGWSNYCLSFVRTGYALPGVYASAKDAWNAAKVRHTIKNFADVPLGAPVFWDSPDSPQYGHVAYANGDGKNVCTTNSGTGYPVIQPYASWVSWGYKPLGWTEDLNGFDVLISGGDSATDNPGGVAVPYVSKTTHATQKLAADSAWTTLKVDDEGSSSFTADPGPFMAVIQVVLAGVPAGTVGQLRCYQVDTEGGGKNAVRANNYPIVEFTGSSGSTYAQLVQAGKPGKATSKGKTSRRVRVEVNLAGKGSFTATYVGVRMFQ